MNKTVFKIEKYLVKYIVQILGKTLRFTECNQRPEYRCIYLFWHRNILPLLYLHRDRGVAVIISASDDGELIAGPAQLFGFYPVRGSSTRGGAIALKEYFSINRERSLAITTDGPKGPKGIVKKSVLSLAHQTGIPIVPVVLNIDKEWLFNTWDVFRVPKPFSKIAVKYGEPLLIEDKCDLEKKLEQLQTIMDKMSLEIQSKEIS